MTSEIDKLKHFHIEDYSGIYYNGAFSKRATDRYSFNTKECSCLKGIRLEDVTAELEEEAYEEMRNNK